MKRILSCMLILSLIFSVPQVISAQEQNTETANLLKALELYEEDNMELHLTRADFCIIMANVLKFSIPYEESVFVDVSEDYYASAAIYTLYRLNLIRGKDETHFCPEDELNMQEAVTLLIRFLEYEQMAQYKGGYPSGYYMIAKDIGLLAGIDYHPEKILSVGAFSKLFENLMEIEVFSVISVNSDGGYTRKIIDGQTVAKVYFNIEIIKDIVTANELTGLNKAESREQGTLIVGTKTVRTAKMEIESYLGYEVKAYCNLENDELMYITKTEKNKTNTLNAKEVNYYSNHKLYYEQKNGEEKYLNIPSSASIIYNKKAINSFQEELFHISKGFIECIDNNNDAVIDVIKISDYKNYVVDSANISSMLIRLKNNDGVLDLKDKYSEYRFLDSEGNPGLLELMNSDQVLTVLENPENHFIEIVYNENSKNGTVTGLEKSTEENIIYLDEQPYPLSDYFIENYKDIKQGDVGIFFLDIFAEIVSYIPLGNESGGYAYMIGAQMEDSLSEAIQFKLFTVRNEMKVLDTANYVYLDGTKMTPVEMYQRLGNGGTVKSQLVWYEVNQKGLLNILDTIEPNVQETDQDLTLMYDSGNDSKTYRSGSMAMEAASGKAVYLSNSCLFFTVQEENGNGSFNEKNFKVILPSSLENGGNYKYKAYKRDKGSLEAEIVVMPPVTQGVYDQYMYCAIIEKISQVVNSEGEIVHKVKYWYRGATVECNAIDDKVVKDLHAGDVILPAQNINSELYDYMYLFNYQEQKVMKEGTNPVKEAHYCSYGAVYDVYDNLFRTTSLNPAAVGEDSDTLSIHRPGKNIYTVTRKSDGSLKIRTGNMADIKAYIDMPENYSMVFSHQIYLSDYDIIIYN